MKRLLLLALVALIYSVGYAQTQTFTANGTFTVPAGVTTVQVEAWGGGGAGGGTNSSSNRGGGGGAGGTYTKNVSVAVTPGSNIAVTVGAGGLGVSNGNGGIGGTSTFASGTPVTAVGGGGGNVGNGTTNYGTGAATATGITFNGGAGSNANSGSAISGAGGGGAGSTGSGGAASGTTGGVGGAGGGGTGAAGLTSGNTNGNDATALSAGGGGAHAGSLNFSNRTGGDGFRGQVKVTWTCPTYALTDNATATGPFCGASTSVVTLRSSSLTSGTYTVTYNLTGTTTATGSTATMTFTAGAPGTGTFTTSSLTAGGNTTVTVTGLASAGCSTTGISSNNSVTVTVTAAPTAAAGTAITTCSTSPAVNITTGSTSTNNAGITWTCNGTGTFTNPNSMTTCTYLPSAADIAAGSRTLTLTATGNGTCANAISTKTLTINSAPTAVAGNAVTTCSAAGAVNITSGASATNQASVTWTSSGTGNFTNASSLTTCTYNPSAADISAGSLILTLTANALAACTNATSTKTLTIISPPGAAGTITGSATVCSTNSLTYSVATVSGATAYTWTVPTGWTINSGQGSNSITVTAGSGGQNGNITVVTSNSCYSTNPSTTINIKPVIGTHNTGYTTSSAKTDNGITTASSSASPERRGYVKFPLNTLPAGAVVTASTLSITNNGSGALSGVTNEVNALGNNDPVTTAASTLYSAINSGANYNSSTWNNTGTIALALNSAANTDIQNRITSPGYIAMGLQRGGGSSIYIFHGYSGGASAPNLAVTYTAPRTLAVTVNAAASAIAGTDVASCYTSGNVNVTAGSSASNNAGINWTSSGTGSFVNANSITLAEYVPSGADILAGNVTLTLTATGNTGCVNAVSTKNFEIGTPASAGAGSDEEFCNPSTLTLGGSIGGVATSSSWSTSGDGAFDDADLLNPVYTFGANDLLNGSVTLTITTNDPAGVCNAAADSKVVLARSAAPAQPAVVTGAPASVCPPVTGIVLNTATDANATSYSWAMSPGTVGVTFNAPLSNNTMVIDLATTANTTYGIRVTATNACGTSVYRGVSIRRAVSAPLNPAGATVACANDVKTYTIPAVTGAETYTWTAPAGGLIDGNPSPYTAAGLTSVNVTFPSGFTSGQVSVAANVACFTTVNKSISVSTATVTVGTITGATYTVCPGQSYTYSVVPVTGAFSYNWTLPANMTGSSSTNSITVTPQAGFASANIAVYATSVCGTPSSPKTRSLVTGVPAQPASVSGPTNGMCNQTAVYTCPSQGGVTYNWTVPGGATINSGNGSNAVSVTHGAFGTGAVCVTASNGCGASVARCNTVKGAPATPAEITANPGSWCANTSGIEFTANVANVTGSYTLSWMYPSASVCTYVIGGGNTNSLTLDWINGSGNVIVTASNACGSGSRHFIAANSCREANEAISESSLTVSPNPAHNVINVNYNAQANGAATVTVTDLSGRVVVKNNVNAQAGYNNAQVDVRSLAKGIYMVALHADGAIKQHKIIIE